MPDFYERLEDHLPHLHLVNDPKEFADPSDQRLAEDTEQVQKILRLNQFRGIEGSGKRRDGPLGKESPQAV